MHEVEVEVMCGVSGIPVQQVCYHRVGKGSSVCDLYT